MPLPAVFGGNFAQLDKPVRSWRDRWDSLLSQEVSRWEIFQAFLKLHQRGKVGPSVPRLVRCQQQPQKSILLEMEGERDVRAAGPTVLPESTNMAGPCPGGESGLFPLWVEAPDSGGRANELQGTEVFGHFRERSAW